MMMAHSNRLYSGFSDSTANDSQRADQHWVDLFDPRQPKQQEQRSPHPAFPSHPATQHHSGIPPLSQANPKAMPPLPDVPASVQARAGLMLPVSAAASPDQTSVTPNQTPMKYPTPRANHQQRRSRRPISTRRSAINGVKSLDFRYLVAGSSLLAGLVLIGDVSAVFQSPSSREVCQKIVQDDSVLSRDALSKLLTVPERENKAAVRDIVSEPYCTLPEIEVRAGVKAQREAYPLAFDPNTWLVLLYEGDEYAGYAFSFQP